MSHADCLAAALAYAARGWAVFPADGKIPFAGTHGSKDATADENTIREWWYRWPRANVVVVCGDKLSVLDIDQHTADGKATLGRYVAQHGVLPLTPVSHTGGGGMHILFEHNPAVKIGELAPGLEFVRQFVAPPSVHPDTHVAYAWDEKCGVETPLAPVPEWLMALSRVDARPQRIITGEELHIAAGNRHAEFLRWGARLRYHGLGEAAVTDCLLAIYHHHCEEPGIYGSAFGERAVRELARDVCKRYQTNGRMMVEPKAPRPKRVLADAGVPL